MNETKWYSSSANATKMSLTIKGILMAVVPVAIFIGGMVGLSVAEADLMQLVEAITTVLSAGMILYGLVRKLILKYR